MSTNRRIEAVKRGILAGILCLGLTTHELEAQHGVGYPVPPAVLPDTQELRLALSAAPAEISAHAAVYGMRPEGSVPLREGTNGVVCMLSRDLHGESLYPICFDREGARTLMRQEMMEVELRMRGKTEAEVKAAVEEAYHSGRIPLPTRPTIAYMLSAEQLLFSSPEASGVRVGPWHPHIMLGMTKTTPADFGLPETATNGMIELSAEHAMVPQLIVRVPRWSNGQAD